MLYNINPTQRVIAQQNALSNYMQQLQMMQQQLASGNSAVSLQQQQFKQQQRVQPTVRAAMYAELRVTNTNLTPVNVLLWDAIGAYQLQNGYVLPAGVTIELTTKQGPGFDGYLLLLRKLIAGSTFFFNTLNMEVTDQLQFGRSIGFYDDSMRADNVSLYDSVYPSQFRNSMQRQLSMIEMAKEYKVHATTSWLYTQEANSTVIFRMNIEEQVIR